MRNHSQLPGETVVLRLADSDAQLPTDQTESVACSIISDMSGTDGESLQVTHAVNEMASTGLDTVIQLAFERGFLKGWQAAIEPEAQIDWENIKIGGTD
jgi:hypothetical protein